MVQTILGSGGSIGVPLARELKNYTDKIRLVSRNPVKINDSDELFPVDLKDFSLIDRAIKGSEVVYVTVGFEYNLKVWQNTWPAFMQEVINSCIRNDSKLVFFDNIYMYSKKSISFMTESSPVDPPSEKGKIRKRLQEMIMNEVGTKKLSAIIIRSADFYGPESNNSALSLMVAENLMKGKKAQVFGDPHKIHTYTYSPDAAKATALLGNTNDAYDQIWHAPTTKEKLTNHDWIELIAKEFSSKVRIQTSSRFMVGVLGLFIPILREFPEMLYQFEEDYIFDSTKFETRFGINSTPPGEGVKRMAESLKEGSQKSGSSGSVKRA